MISSRAAALHLIVWSVIASGVITAIYRPTLPYLWPSYWSGWIIVLMASIGLGSLEAAWTGLGRGGPVDTWKGVGGIYLVLFLFTMPHVWLIPLLAIIEEMTHGFLGYPGWRPTWETLLEHWSSQYIGVNLYPYLTFPLLTIGIEVLYRFL